jgi:hypothetical protein
MMDSDPAEAGVRSVAGRQADLNAARGHARKATDDGAIDKVAFGGIGDSRTKRRTGKPARGGVLHAGRQAKRQNEKKGESFPHDVLPRVFVVIEPDSTDFPAEAK